MKKVKIKVEVYAEVPEGDHCRACDQQVNNRCRLFKVVVYGSGLPMTAQKCQQCLDACKEGTMVKWKCRDCLTDFTADDSISRPCCPDCGVNNVARFGLKEEKESPCEKCGWHGEDCSCGKQPKEAENG